MLEKKIFNVAIFHDGHFNFCPSSTHSHTSKITLIANSGLLDFTLDNIVPCHADNLEAFFSEFQRECKAANVELVSIEIYFSDIDLSYFYVY